MVWRIKQNQLKAACFFLLLSGFARAEDASVFIDLDLIDEIKSAPPKSAVTEQYIPDQRVEAIPLAPPEEQETGNRETQPVQIVPQPQAAAKKRLAKPVFTAGLPKGQIKNTSSSNAPIVSSQKAGATVTEDITTEPAAPAEAMQPQAQEVPAFADLTLEFVKDAGDVSEDLQKKLDKIAVVLKDMEGGRIQVRAYATGTDGAETARRLSLSRALAVRSYLMEQGVQPVKIDVRALGSETDRQPLDRVDIVFVR